jgi:DNA replication regulator SLD3
MQRQQPRKPRRTLERVLTDEKSRRRMPSLSRSATDSAVPNLKREVSDTSLSAVPLNRLNIQKSKRYSLREVDLNAVSQAAEARLKKKASVEQELKGAIAALKKPNPRMAVKEFVEAAEKRVAGSHRRSKQFNYRGAM